MLLDGPIVMFNLRYMFLLGHIIQVDSKISHLWTQWFKLTIRMYTGDPETTLQVQFIDLLDPILNVLHFSDFDHTYRRKYNMSGYGVDGSNDIDLYEITK